jgi:hypothetical protein
MTNGSHGGKKGHGKDKDKGGQDKGGQDKGGQDKGGYDKGGYDKGGRDKGGYDKDGYDKDGYDRDRYDRDGCTPDQPDQPTGGDCGEPVTVSLMTEGFNGLCSLDNSDNVQSDSGWKSYGNGAYANGCNDGALVFAELDSAGLDSVTLTFDIVSSNVCNFESSGRYADDFTVEFWDGDSWEVLDIFVRDGNALVGSVSGQSFGACEFSELSYTISEPAAVTQFRFTADFTASNEAILVDNVVVTGEFTEACPTDCEPVVVALMTEDFDGLCAPRYSDNVASDANWRSRYDAAYADGCNDGALVFDEVDTSGLTEVTFTFEIVSSNVCNFEAGGRYRDDLAVEYYDGSAWQTLDTFVRDGNALVGETTGQSFGDRDWTELSFTVSDPGDAIQFRIVADFSAANEKVLVDNVEITGLQPGDCDPELGSLGDWVWLDGNRNGIQDAGELGVEGITVELLKDGVLTGDMQLTDAAGGYLFTDLEAGNYAIQVSGTGLAYTYTTQNEGGVEGADSDVDRSGLSDTFALAEGEHRLDLDAGLVALGGVATLGSLGDVIWLDVDKDGVQDADEVGVVGITVELLQDGVATGRTVVTGNDGLYLFEDLDAADYSIQISGIASGFEITAQNASADDAVDSDVNAAGLSDTYTLSDGEDYFDLDAGIHAIDPTVGDDMGKTCADTVKELDVLANDDANLTITAINGVAIDQANPVTLASGAIIAVTASGTLTYDGVAAWAGLSFMQHATDVFTYTATTVQGGAATATVNMMIGGNDAVNLDEIALSLTGSVEFTITDHFAIGAGFSVTTTSVENTRLNVTDSYNVYCIDLDGDVRDGFALEAEVLIADPADPAIAALMVNVDNLDLVNYILNQDYLSQGYTGNEIQDAIWYLTDDEFTLFMPNVAAIVADAETFGEGFEAGAGDLVGLILAPLQEVDENGFETTNYQNFIYAVEFDTLADCI